MSPNEGLASLPPVPAGSAVRRIAFDAGLVEILADELGVPAHLASFGAGDAPVHRLRLPLRPGPVTSDGADGEGDRGRSPVGGIVTTVTIWPALGRVDTASAAAATTVTGILAVDLVPGVEVIFRHAGGSLTLTRNGRVMVRAGAGRAAVDRSGADGSPAGGAPETPRR